MDTTSYTVPYVSTRGPQVDGTLQELLHSPGGDLPECVVLEERPHGQPQVVAVIVLSADGDIARSRSAGHSSARSPNGLDRLDMPPLPYPGAVQQPLLQQRLRLPLRLPSRGHVPQPAVPVAEPGPRTT